ncbi:MAG: universal stress protein [Gammaproteobacteria bacterium]|nr:universal stress protein [Gammaproteobacteria bacterium]
MKAPQNLPIVDYKKVLYVTDLSETGRFAFPHAASIASHYQAALTVFHVVETTELEQSLSGYMSEELWEQLKTRNLEEAREILIGRKRDGTEIKDTVDQFCQNALAGNDDQAPTVTYDIVVKSGDAVDEIIAEAHGGNYDLVVMGNHGRRAMTDILLGSTAWRVLHRCTVPVMIVQLPTGQG